MTQSDPDDGMVVLPRGYFQIPKEFYIELIRQAGTTPVSVGVSVVMVDGRPCARDIVITTTTLGADADPIPGSDLLKLDLSECLVVAVREMAIMWAKDDAIAIDDAKFDAKFDAKARRLRARAHAAAAASNDQRSTITPEVLRHVLAAHETGGIAAVRELRGCSERNARRLLARARAFAAKEN